MKIKNNIVFMNSMGQPEDDNENSMGQPEYKNSMGPPEGGGK